MCCDCNFTQQNFTKLSKTELAVVFNSKILILRCHQGWKVERRPGNKRLKKKGTFSYHVE